jgi:hypothetical protein
MVIGASMMAISNVLSGVSGLATEALQREAKSVGYGWETLVQALLQTVGAMILASTDIDFDLFAKRNRINVLPFALSWFILVAFQMFEPTRTSSTSLGIVQVRWIATMPMAYLLLRFQAVLHMRESYPRCTDLFAYSFALDLATTGVRDFLRIYDPSFHGVPWGLGVEGSLYFVSGVTVLSIYRHFRSRSLRRLAFSASIYAYLLGKGFCSLVWHMINQYLLYHRPYTIGYAFAIVHITFPMAYFLFRRAINTTLGRRWLEQRKGANSKLGSAEVAETRGNLAEVETVITSCARAHERGNRADLNAFVFFTEEDEFTLLHLAVLNGHHDSIQRLLQTGVVQANKPSGSRGHTALFLAAELGRLHAVVLLLEHSADVNTLADDGQSALIVASANGHTKVAALLRENGANEKHEWMGLRAHNIKNEGGGEGEEEEEMEEEDPGRKRVARTKTQRALVEASHDSIYNSILSSDRGSGSSSDRGSGSSSDRGSGSSSDRGSGSSSDRGSGSSMRRSREQSMRDSERLLDEESIRDSERLSSE